LKLNVVQRIQDPGGAGFACDGRRPQAGAYGDADKFHDECGVFGIFGHSESANLTYLGIHALQHRGQESAGIASLDKGEILLHKGMGLVPDVFDAETLQKLPGDAAIGHTRYSTAGQSRIENAQPFYFKSSVGPIAVAHNGNLVNAEEVRAELESQGAIFQGSSDTELLLHLIAREKGVTALERIQSALERVRGAYTLLFLTQDSIVAVRDPLGFRPLLIGNLRGKTVFASESCALDLIEAELVRQLAVEDPAWTVGLLGWLVYGTPLLGVRHVTVQGTGVLRPEEVRAAAAIRDGTPLASLDLAAVRRRGILPVVVDESCIVAADIPRLAGAVDGINIKLAKCGSLREALRMIATARAHGMLVMVGCMIESSLGITAAAHFTPLVDAADLDGAALTANDPFVGATIDGGQIRLPTEPGLGVSRR